VRKDDERKAYRRVSTVSTKLKTKFMLAGIAAFLIASIAFLIYNLTRESEILYPTGELRIAVDASFPPFAVATEHDLFGIDIDIGRALGARLGVPVRFINMGYDGLYDSLRAEQADIILSALIINPIRRGEVRYTRPYFDAGLVLVGTLSSMEDAAGHSIAYEFGSVGDQEVRRWQRLVEQPLEAMPFELPEYALDAARLGIASGALIDAVSAGLYLHQHPDWQPDVAYATSSPYSIAVRLDRLGLFLEVDAALGTLLAEGTIDAIVGRYLAVEH
jgi:polar amino acid transport system substrate-binding protein